MGLLDPATSDGRVIFFLPWENMTIAGTTDTPTSVTAHPIPGEDDINFILREVRNYLSPDVEGTGALCDELLSSLLFIFYLLHMEPHAYMVTESAVLKVFLITDSQVWAFSDALGKGR